MVLIDGHTRCGNSPLQAMCLSRKREGMNVTVWLLACSLMCIQQYFDFRLGQAPARTHARPLPPTLSATHTTYNPLVQMANMQYRKPRNTLSVRYLSSCLLCLPLSVTWGLCSHINIALGPSQLPHEWSCIVPLLKKKEKTYIIRSIKLK